MRIRKEDTIAIVVDYQERLMPSIYNHEEVVKNSAILINGLKALDIPIIVTEQYPKGLGSTVEEIKSITEGFEVYEKLTFSCYLDENIKKAVDSFGKKNVIVIGTETHICVLQTIIDLKEAGYNVIIIGDCVSSRREYDKDYGLKRAVQEGAIVSTYEAILFELTEVAGTPEFKIISKLIK